MHTVIQSTDEVKYYQRQPIDLKWSTIKVKLQTKKRQPVIHKTEGYQGNDVSLLTWQSTTSHIAILSKRYPLIPNQMLQSELGNKECRSNYQPETES